MAQKSVAFQKTWNSHLGRAGSLPPAELHTSLWSHFTCRWDEAPPGMTLPAVEQPPGLPSHCSCKCHALSRAQVVGTWVVLVVQKMKLPLSLYCYFYPFIFNANIFHSDFFQMGRNAFPGSTAYSSWPPQATVIWRNAFTARFTCSCLGGFLLWHGTMGKSIEE